MNCCSSIDYPSKILSWKPLANLTKTNATPQQTIEFVIYTFALYANAIQIMLTPNSFHYPIRGVYHWLSIATFFTSNSTQTFVFSSLTSVSLLCISFIAVHLCTTTALSVDANLKPSFSPFSSHHHKHVPERGTTGKTWSVDDWWQDRVFEDRQRKNAAMTRPHSHGRSFEPSASADDEWQYSASRSIFESSRPVPQIRAEDVLDEEDDIDTAESIPSKRHWPSTNAVHFPPFSRVDHGDLDSAESTERKSSTGDFKNRLIPKWKSQKNATTVGDSNQNHTSKSKPTVHSYVPKSSLASIRNFFNEFFTTIRSSAQESSRLSFITVKRNLRRKFLELGLSTGIQSFNVTRIRQRQPTKGHNLIGIWPGNYRNSSGLDSILVIGAHYDTVPQSIGIQDNASGSTAVLELARLLQEYKCSLNTTIIFVLFDMEEDGLHGSKHFVRDYLYPVEIDQRRASVKGAIVMDMLLEYDTSIDSQNINDLGPLVPSWREAVSQNGNRADFAAVWARRSSIDTALYKALKRNWLNQPKYKLLQMDVPLPPTGRQLTRELRNYKLNAYKTFLRSDHSSFWYPHALKDQSIAAILLTDLGPWRRRVASRYHSSGDNTKLLTKQNLLFLKNSIDSLMKTLLELGEGTCEALVIPTH